MCGEKSKWGSVKELSLWITPACAGKRLYSACVSSAGRDHPRVCGEKATISEGKMSDRGSPPRVRGKAHAVNLFEFNYRITPACAGKRPWSKRRGGSLSDHPRVCGEKKPCFPSSRPTKGSPPRVRGKVLDAVGNDAGNGITPACAGKRLKKAHKIKDFDPVPIRFHLVFRRFERWCSNLPTPDGNVPV